MTSLVKNSVNKVRRYLQYSAGVYLAFVFLSGALPPISMQFTGVLPYLNEWQFYERLIFVFLNWCFAIFFYLIVSTEKQKKSVLLTIQFNLKDWILGVLGILLFICSGAWLASNSLGPLVKILPNELYTARMVIVNVEAEGSRNKSANLDLKSIADGKIYYLTLSKRLFNYPKFNVGDKLILKGRQNWFGVYVEEFQRIK